MSDTHYADELHTALVAHLERQGGMTSRHDHDALRAAARHLIERGGVMIPAEKQNETIRQVLDRMLGWGPLTTLLSDPTVTEIMVNGPHSVYVERAGILERLTEINLSGEEILQIMSRMVSMVDRRIDTASPLVDARLPDGSRVNAIIPPLSLTGPVLTIRRFPSRPLMLDDLVKKGTLTESMAKFLQAAIAAKQNIVISGGTGSGKTTTLNALASCIPNTERIITIEDAAEMQLTHPHLISLEARPSNLEGKGEIPVRLLLKNALRMRPDRIIVGEIRGGEALDMLQAMNTGHQGSLTTVHANAPLEALLRIETMTLMADLDLPLSAIRQQISQALHLVVQQERLRDGRRVISVISEVTRGNSTENEPYALLPLYTFDKRNDKFCAEGHLPLFEDAYRNEGVMLNAVWFA